MPESTHPFLRLPWTREVSVGDLPPTILEQPGVSEAPELSGAYPLGWTPRPAGEVQKSWLRQLTLVEAGDVTVRLQARLDEPGMAGVAGDQHADQPVPQWPLAEPLLVIGAVRGPSVVYADEAAASRAEIVRQLELFGVAATPASTVDRGHGWAEPSVIAHPSTDKPLADWQERALNIARQMGIDTVVQVADGQWSVLSLGDLPSRRYSTIAMAPASITLDVEHRCPMQVCPGRGEYCRMRGGPWTSSSIRAATGWFDLRNSLVEAVGCDTCEGDRYWFQGQVRTSGGPIRIVPSPMPTRWLAADETELDQDGIHGQS